MKKIRYITAVLAAISVFAFSGCSKKSVDKSDVIGVLLRNDSDTFIKEYKEAVEKAASDNNASIQIYSANNDAAIQIDQLKTMLLNGVRHFVIIPYSTDLTDQMAKMIYSQGGSAAFSNIVPSVSALKVGPNIFYSSSPELDAGEYQAQLIDSYFKKHPEKAPGKVLKIAYFNGEYGHPAQTYRKDGVYNGLERLGYKMDFAFEYGANWDRASARQSLDMWLESQQRDVNVVIAQNDQMALGAVDALIKNGYVDDKSNPTRDTDGDGLALTVAVFGVDGTTEAQESMARNQMCGTVLQDAKIQALTAFELVNQCKKTGSAKGYVTTSGIAGAQKTTYEPPLNEPLVIGQCYIVPFVPMGK